LLLSVCVCVGWELAVPVRVRMRASVVARTNSKRLTVGRVCWTVDEDGE